MSTTTSIEWTDTTWNPTTGCDQVSAGCDNCYALGMAKRLKAMGSAKYQQDGDPRTSGPGFGISVHPETLDEPYSWRKPRKVFVNSMSDLFHARVPLAFIRQVFAVMADTPQHTYQVLTKRASRLPKIAHLLDWPPNVWMGTSVEDVRVMHRVDDLREVPAAVRFLSCEPLLGPLPDLDLTGIGWVIAGGESGPKARPMHPDWVRDLRDRCATAKVPFFFKQWGEWAPESHLATERGAATALYIEHDGSVRPAARGARGNAVTVQRNGKKHTGRRIDDRTHDEFPESAA
jgi:protein gp37